MTKRGLAASFLALTLGVALCAGASAQRKKRAGRLPPPVEVEAPVESAPEAPAAAPPVAPEPVLPEPAPVDAASELGESGDAPATAEAAEQPPAQADAATSAAELAALQAELAAVMDELVQARARVAVLGKSLFATTVRVRIENDTAPDQQAVRAMLRLDGAPIWTGDAAAMRDPDRILFEGYAAPGPHVLELEIEQRSRDDDAYGYTLRESYRFTVLQKHRTDLRLVLEDDSDMAEDFGDDQEGEYDVTTRLEVKAVAKGED
jgi:hypothetical protein